MDVIFLLPSESTNYFSFDKVVTISISFLALVISITSFLLNRREATRKEKASIFYSARNVKTLLHNYDENIDSDESYRSLKPYFDNLELHLGWMPESYGVLVSDFFIAYNTAKTGITLAEKHFKYREQDLKTKKEKEVDTDLYNERYKEHYRVFKENLEEAELLIDKIMEYVKPKKRYFRIIFRL
jgi:hypothetical protein